MGIISSFSCVDDGGGSGEFSNVTSFFDRTGDVFIQNILAATVSVNPPNTNRSEPAEIRRRHFGSEDDGGMTWTAPPQHSGLSTTTELSTGFDIHLLVEVKHSTRDRNDIKGSHIRIDWSQWMQMSDFMWIVSPSSVLLNEYCTFPKNHMSD